MVVGKFSSVCLLSVHIPIVMLQAKRMFAHTISKDHDLEGSILQYL